MKAELLILGVLHRGNFHPYEIKRRLRNALVECYIDVDVGTLYYAIRRLEADGLIEVEARERVRRGGARTVYALTPAGRRRFQVLLTERFAAEGPVEQTLYAALLFLHLADAAAVAPLLRAKLAGIEAGIEELRRLQRQMAPVLSTGGRHLMKHLAARRRLDRRWLKRLIADVAAGRVEDVADPRRLAAAARPPGGAKRGS